MLVKKKKSQFLFVVRKNGDKIIKKLCKRNGKEFKLKICERKMKKCKNFMEIKKLKTANLEKNSEIENKNGHWIVLNKR